MAAVGLRRAEPIRCRPAGLTEMRSRALPRFHTQIPRGAAHRHGCASARTTKPSWRRASPPLDSIHG